MTNTTSKSNLKAQQRDAKKIEKENKQLHADVDELKKLVRVMARNAKLQDKSIRALKNTLQNTEQQVAQLNRKVRSL